MFSIIVYYAPTVLALVVLVAVIGAFVAFREGRRAPYFRIRREASRRGWRWLTIALFGAAVFWGLLAARAYVPPPVFKLSLLKPTPTPGTGIALDQVPTPTLNLSLIPKLPEGGPPTITPTQATPTITSTPIIVTIESLVTPPAGAVLTISAISSGISPSLTPVNAGTVFPTGIPRVYYWVEFDNMVNGVSWSQVLLLNGTVIRSESEAWDRGEEGTAYYFFGAQDGWPAGSYEIRFYLGDQLVASATYIIGG